MSFSEFGLHKDIVTSLVSAGYEHPTPLQKQLIPLIMERKNVIIDSQTASGKTGSYLIPLASHLMVKPSEDYSGARTLILTSRRDRVNQINYTLKKIINEQPIRTGFISGGRPYQHQMRLLKRPLDILIATPGRLNDLVQNNKSDFSNLETLIIDDFSIIYHHGLQDLCKSILEKANDDCVTIGFVQKNDPSSDYLHELLPTAEKVEVPEEKHPLLSVPQHVYISDDHTHKIAIIDQMMDELNDESLLVFTNSNKSAETLQESLANNDHQATIAHKISSDTKIHSEEFPIIIISDQSGVNFDARSYKNIIHFDLPKQINAFQLRVTNHGWEELERPASILVGPNDRVTLKKIESTVGESLEQRNLPGLEALNPYLPTPLLTLGKNDGKKGKKGAKNNRRGNSHLGGKTNKNNNRQKQHKGPYGRLNGGIHRKRDTQNPQPSSSAPSKRSGNGNGGNTSGNGNNYNNRPKRNFNQSSPSQSNYRKPAFNQNHSEADLSMQELGERKPMKRKVVIRYKDRKKSQSRETPETPTSE